MKYVLFAILILASLSQAFGDDVNLHPNGGDYLLNDTLTVTTSHSVDPDPRGFCGCDSSNQPRDWEYIGSTPTISGDATSSGVVDTSSTGQRDVFAHATYSWSCPANEQTDTTEGTDDGQAIFKIYGAGFTGPNEVYIDSNATYHAKKMPDDTPISGDWSAENGAPSSGASTSFTTKWDSPGDHGISATIEGTQYSRTVRVKLPDVEIKEISFTSDHGVMRDNNSNFSSSGALYEAPEWTPQRNHPISHTKGTKVEIMLKVGIGPADLPSKNYLIKGTGAGGLSFEKSVSLSGGSNNLVFIEASQPLHNKVHLLNESINWEIKLGSEVVENISTGPHRVYVTFGVPSVVLNTTNGMPTQASIPTEKRIATVVGYCSGLQSDESCADSIFWNLHWAKYGGADPFGPDNRWEIYGLGPHTVMCAGLAFFLQDHFRMLGLAAGNFVMCRPRSDGGFEASPIINGRAERAISTTVGHPSGTGHEASSNIERLFCWDAQNIPNQYEATINKHGKYYGVGEDIFYTPKETVLAISSNGIVWCYNPDGSAQKCTYSLWSQSP